MLHSARHDSRLDNDIENGASISALWLLRGPHLRQLNAAGAHVNIL